MNNEPKKIFSEYLEGSNFKSSIGSRGIFEQSRINERFYIGDQWHGARCGNDRPLVRHNVIKRIGDYKMSQIINSPININFSADGVPTDNSGSELINQNFVGEVSEKEINYIMSLFNNYSQVTAERVKLNDINERVLRNSYISGCSVLYTYWDPSVTTGLFADKEKRVKLKGDICCEVLNIEDVVFGDPYSEDVESQPYIIISSRQEIGSVLREARLAGADIATLRAIEESAKDSKVTVLTKFFKRYLSDGSATVKCTKVTENAVVREEYDTLLRLYPLALFCWERQNNLIYGQSEVTYLIPNQIAINRMITANVWSTMTNGMPIMLVNGDTVTQKITNDPGQIIKVFGSNEDVAGAVKYLSPPNFSEDLNNSINSLITNTLTQNGANEVALGDSRADNASALAAMRDAALMPMQIVKNRFYTFIEDVTRIWADFWITHYGRRNLKVENRNNNEYISFNGDRYKELAIRVKVDVSTAAAYSERERTEMLLTFFEKGIINREELLKRLPKGAIPDVKSLLAEEREDSDERI